MAARGSGCDEQCWICLDDASEDGNRQLMSPCKCPRKVHPQCLARWQLQQAGRHEEKFCRFCNSSLEDWKTNLTPKNLAPEISKVQPVMVVYFEGQIHRIPVKQGPEGLAEFQTKIRTLFRLPEDVDISLTFGCKEPMSGQHLKLEGVGAFDAAVHCASVAAADRQQRVKRSQSASDLAGGGPAPRSGARGSGAAAETAAAAGTPVAPAAPATPAPIGRSRSHTVAASAPRVAPRGGGGRSRSFHVPLRSPLFAAPQLQLPPALPEASPAAAGSGSPQPATPATPPQLAARAAAATSPGIFRSAFAAAAGRAGSPSPPPPQPASPGSSSSALTPEDEEEAAATGAVAQGAPKQGPEAPAVGRGDSGSLGGRIKVSFKAFSRRVARSLSYNAASRSSGSSLAAADGSAGPSGLGRAASAALPLTATAAAGPAVALA